uniref:Complement component c3b, tandem duplicate 2 n=1 Tax=Scleropages formosus TaxID=113540 RepID=A0A8C9QY15_SCLFO
ALESSVQDLIFLVLVFNFLSSTAEERFIILSPNLLRTDSEENFYLEANGVSDPLLVTITFQDFPARRVQLHKDTVLLNKDNDYKALKTVKLPSHGLSRKENSNSYVYLTVDFGSHRAEKILMVSFQSGYIFVQTDKPLFNPGDIVALPCSLGCFHIYFDFLIFFTLHSEGTWKITAKFDNSLQNKFSSEFEVRKYVLPAFNVTLTPKRSYFSVDDSELEVDVRARYLYGEPVKGFAYIVFGVEVNKEKKRLPDTIQRVEDVTVLRMADIKRDFANIQDLVGCPIYIKASVITSTGSDLVEAEMSGIKIVESPFLITFRGTPRYFKPGLPFDMMVQVTHQDGSLAPNIPFQLRLQSESVTVSTHRGVSRVSLNMPPDTQPQTITAETTKHDLKAEHQAKGRLLVHPYVSFSNTAQNYLYISTGTKRVSAGEHINLEFHLKNSIETHKDIIKHLTYLVINKGKIIAADRVLMNGQRVTSFSLAITPEMIPSFRIVAFYILPWLGTSEVVADSVWLDVEDTCMGTLRVGKADGSRQATYRPGESFRFQVRGDPGSRVSLLAVDNAVFLLNNRHRLTQSKLWRVVESADISCTPGSGRDSVGVFDDAGLMFHSNNAMVTEARQSLQCLKQARKRSVRMLQNKVELEDQYKDRFLRKCCQDGLREIPMDYSCIRRSHYISEGWECVQAFLYCCSQYRGEPGHLPTPVTTRATTTAIPISQWDPRIHILQSRVMLASKQFMVASAVSTVEDYEEEEDDMVNERDVYVRSKFFETWLWNEIRFCVAEPYNIIAKRHFFVDLRLPYSVARNEQVEVKAMLHNYSDEDMKVIVILYKTVDICSVAYIENHQQEVTLHAQSSRVIPYIIVPLKAGELELEVKALARDFRGQDGVRKRLRVLSSQVLQLSLSKNFLDGKQVIKIDNIKVDSVVPNSVPETYINVRGSVLADTIDNSITDDSLASLLRMPGGCVEQNLASMTLPLIATHYLDRAHQWETVGVQRRLDAVKYIQKGYEKQLMYSKKDNSYPPYRNVGTSTWITSYVVKVFSMAHPIIYVNEKHICDPLLYLLKQKQSSDGAFSENNPVYAAAMTEQMRKAATYLKNQLPRLRRPYSVAITTYALALMGEDRSLLRDHLQKAASADRTHWPDSDNPLFTLEATGYALMAHLKIGETQFAGQIFQWLNERRKVGGSYGSTQPTMVVLQGLSDYLIQNPPPLDMKLNVALSMPGRRDTHWSFSSKTAYIGRSAKVCPFNLPIVQFCICNRVVTIYNELPHVENKGNCKHFDLEVSIKQVTNRKYCIICFYKFVSLGPSEIRMAILDVTLPTGFVPKTEDLEKLTNSVDRYINNFEIVDGLSDQGSLIIHLFKVSNTERETISFGLLQKFNVGLIQPSSVTVYEYYSADHRCTKFYSPLSEKAELQQICKNETCRCSEGVQVCVCVCVRVCVRESVFRVSKISRSQYDRNEVEILQVIKEGRHTGIRMTDKSIFLSHAACRGGLNLQEGGVYLVMGPPEDFWHLDGSTNRFTYILSKRTWVEYWPLVAECQADAVLRQRCSQLEEFASDVLEKGCHS